MLDRDKKEFIKILSETQEYYDKSVSQASANIYWNALAEVSLEDYKNAMSLHIRTSKFMPKVADILEAIPDRSGWPDPEEAWNALPKSEYEGGYVNQAMGVAMGASMDSVERGDMVAGRMAFIESYKSEVAKHKRNGERPNWWPMYPSYGTHEQKNQIKQQMLLTARDKEWISIENFNDANRLLEAPIKEDNPVMKMIRQQPIGIGSSETENH